MNEKHLGLFKDNSITKRSRISTTIISISSAILGALFGSILLLEVTSAYHNIVHTKQDLFQFYGLFTTLISCVLASFLGYFTAKWSQKTETVYNPILVGIVCGVLIGIIHAYMSMSTPVPTFVGSRNDHIWLDVFDADNLNISPSQIYSWGSIPCGAIGGAVSGMLFPIFNGTRSKKIKI